MDKHADVVTMSETTANAMSRIGLGEFNTMEQPERVAWLILVLEKLEDRPEWFLRGKWATIQYLEEQVNRCAQTAAEAAMEPEHQGQSKRREGT